MRQQFSGTAERIFMKLLPNDRGKCSLHRRTQMGARPPNNILGTKNWKIAKNADLELATLNFDCTADALKRHERANAFNLVKYDNHDNDISPIQVKQFLKLIAVVHS